MDKNIATEKRVMKTSITKLKDKIYKTDLKICEVEQLDLLKEKVEKLNEEISRVFKSIFSTCEEKDIDSFITERDEQQDIIDDLIVKLKHAKANRSITKVEVPKKETTSEVKLPKLALPSFSGQIHEWLSFKDLFIASIHNNGNLSPAQKLQYLKLSCHGDALKIIKSIPIEDSKYEVAWELLSERFSNKRELIYSHIRKLLSQQFVQSDSPSAILNMVDLTNECVRSFEILDQEVSGLSETLLIYFILQKLDQNIKLWWERQLKNDELPKLSQLTDFLKDYARSLQSSKNNVNYKKNNYSKLSTMTASVNNFECKYCNSRDHKIFKCTEFFKLSVNERIQFVKSKNLCFNCLNSDHKVVNCQIKRKCIKCNLKSHNSLLHYEKREAKLPVTKPQTVPLVPCEQNTPTLNEVHNINTSINSCFGKLKYPIFGILATALINVKDVYNEHKLLRCIIDVGSTSNFISERAIQLLGLKRNKAKLQIKCLGSHASEETRGVVNLEFSPHFDKQTSRVGTFFILKNITNNQPAVPIDINSCGHLKNIKLADPKWHEPGQIDLLFGVSISLSIIRGEKIFGKSGMPFAVNSDYGWLISGDSELCCESKPNIIVNFANTENDYVKRFWELENIPTTDIYTSEEKYCEEYFDLSHSRDSKGRYIVRLPFKRECSELGESKSLAMKRFLNLEKRFKREPDIHEKYCLFMKEYLDMGHMEKISKNEIRKPVNETFYLPHHPVIRESSTTTRLRVVFDGSAKSDNNVSINDNLIVGPRIQQDLFFILLRFRTHAIAINADIAKMFRQIKVFSEDQNFQRILWRDQFSDDISEYRLNTVTYGLSSSPYLATKVLQKLALDEKQNFPFASKIVLRDFYVDDLLTGASSPQKAIELISELDKLMKRGGFELRKWSSNDVNVLKLFPEELIQTKSDLSIESENSVNVLGLKWDSNRDVFKISVNVEPSLKEVTKRTILSDIAKMFDPLGWISPFVVLLKILLQELWCLHLKWDDPVPLSIKGKWMEIRKQLKCLTCINVPRLAIIPSAKIFEIHAFSDASLKAYGAVIYLRSSCDNSTVSVRLLTAKTRVSPLKTVSLPKLELCAALISARLVKAIQDSLCLNISKINCWTDSTIVLSWLCAESRRWQTFVSNRVSEIQQLVPFECWNHIKGKENPADCASRGLLPSELPSHELWWNGPKWLSDSSFTTAESQPVNILCDEALLEQRKTYFCATAQISEEMPILSRISSFSKLKRVIAWCLRFIKNSRLPILKRNVGFLTKIELECALNCIIKQVQISAFSAEIHCISKNKCLPHSSKLLNLTPILDKNGILRVGGRLRHANLTQDQIHPILLPKNHPVTALIVRYFHLSHFHAGSQLLLCVIRQKYWILSGRSVVRKFVRNCVKCARASASMSTQIMADLPSTRVQPSRVFFVTGVDYAGPILCKFRKGRGVKSFKCYIAIFVCFSTRAIHIELVSDLSTPAFLACLKRFVSRRGKPKEIVSDCATNFVGANKELKEMYKILSSSDHNEEVERYLISEEINWRFNPPSAPHFGGLWEAAVKSMKFHLKRTIGNSVLTFEELTTLLAQIEACLNSRPICPLSSDPNDLMALTPGHFLIGAPLTAIPEGDISDVPESRLSRWQLVQRVFQHFWKRWSNEYLSTLQQKAKWNKEEPNVQVGDLVIIKNEGLSPLQWRLARVIKTHPGPDKRVRVVTLKTENSEIKRPIVKLCKLPLE